MSAMPSMATESVPRNEPTRCANQRHHLPSFDQVVHADGHLPSTERAFRHFWVLVAAPGERFLGVNPALQRGSGCAKPRTRRGEKRTPPARRGHQVQRPGEGIALLDGSHYGAFEAGSARAKFHHRSRLRTRSRNQPPAAPLKPWACRCQPSRSSRPPYGRHRGPQRRGYRLAPWSGHLLWSMGIQEAWQPQNDLRKEYAEPDSQPLQSHEVHRRAENRGHADLRRRDAL